MTGASDKLGTFFGNQGPKQRGQHGEAGACAWFFSLELRLENREEKSSPSPSGPSRASGWKLMSWNVAVEMGVGELDSAGSCR